MATLSSYDNITEVDFQTLSVNGFYGPGAWAAWCVTLIASWAPILRDEYTHNLQYITYAMYMNAAAIDVFRNVLMDRKFDKLASGVKESLRQAAEAGIPLSRTLGEARDKEGLCTVRTTGIGSEESITLATARFGPWQWDATEFEEQASPHTPQEKSRSTKDFQTHLATHMKACRQLTSQWVQARAAISILNLGSLNATAQLLFTIRKNLRAIGSRKSSVDLAIVRRNLIIFAGQIIPLIALHLHLLDHRHDVDPRWVGGVITHMGLLASTSVMTMLSMLVLSIYGNWPTEFGAIFGPLYDILIGASLIGRCVWAVLVGIFVDRGLRGRCLLVPCTPVKMSEFDQAFTLFAAIVYFLYEFGHFLYEIGMAIPRGSRFLGLRIKRLVQRLWLRTRPRPRTMT